MDKETSSRVSSIASEILHQSLRPAQPTPADYDALMGKAKTLAASCLSQDEHKGQQPTTFLDRLKREHAGLSGRIDALTLFFDRGAPDIDDDQRELLRAQLSTMKLYLHILDMRLLKLNTGSIEQSAPVASPPAKLPEGYELGELREIQNADEDRDGPAPFNG
jgi:hypothetical protein